jgi:hypothetical protein
MTGYEKIKRILTPQSRMTTAEIAKHVGLSVGHIGRVLRWMDKHGHARLIPGSSPYQWSA